MQKNRGVEFVLGRRCLEYNKDPNGNVNKIILREKTVDTEHLVYFPNNFWGNTEYFLESYYKPDMAFDNRRRVCVNIDLNSNINRVYAAGEVCAPENFRNSERYRNCSHGSNIVQGMIAGFNIMGLGIPYHIVPYEDFDLYGHKFKEIGGMSFHDRVIVDGDANSFDFTAYYVNAKLGVLKAAGIQKKSNHMAILREAIRTNTPIEPNHQNPTEFSKIDISRVEQSIRVACHSNILGTEQIRLLQECYIRAKV